MELINAPGRFDRSPRLLRGDVRRWTSMEGVSVVTFSEVADPQRAAVLARDGWTVTKGKGRGAGECAILTRDARLEVVYSAVLQLTDGGGGGRLTNPIEAPVVIARTQSGRLALISMAHLPAHVEGIWAAIPLPARTKARVLRNSKRPRIRTYLEAVQSWRRQVTALAAQYAVDDVVLPADWNLNAHAKWVPHLIANAWPDLDIVATRAADLDRRTIGWVLTSMDLLDARVFTAESSDHKAGLYHLRHVAEVAPTPPTKPIPKPDPAPAPPEPTEPETITVYPAIQAAREQSRIGGFPGIGGDNPGAGWCLKMVRMCYGIPAREPDAASAWRTAKVKHTGKPAPRGYPVFWTGGSEGHGHIAIATGDGNCWSTDIHRTGFFDVCPITEIHERWGLTFVGWAEDINGVAVVASKEIEKK